MFGTMIASFAMILTSLDWVFRCAVSAVFVALTLLRIVSRATTVTFKGDHHPGAGLTAGSQIFFPFLLTIFST